jgi:hypothetical protein
MHVKLSIRIFSWSHGNMAARFPSKQQPGQLATFVMVSIVTKSPPLCVCLPCG